MSASARLRLVQSETSSNYIRRWLHYQEKLLQQRTESNRVLSEDINQRVILKQKLQNILDQHSQQMDSIQNAYDGLLSKYKGLQEKHHKMKRSIRSTRSIPSISNPDHDPYHNFPVDHNDHKGQKINNFSEARGRSIQNQNEQKHNDQTMIMLMTLIWNKKISD